MRENSRKGGIFVAILIVLITFSAMLPYVSPAVLMTDMMADMQIEYAAAGLTISIIVAIGGICMFISTFVQGRLGLWNTIALALFFYIAGDIICFAAGSFPLFMLGRIFIGAGYGLGSNCTNPIINYWYKGKPKTYMVTLYLCASSLGMALAYQVATPLSVITGSWQGIFIAFGIFTAIVAVLWIVAGRVLDAPGIPEKKNVTIKQAIGQSSLFMAFRVKQFWIIMIIAILMVTISTTNGSYLVTILTTEKGFTDTLAATVSSVCSATGIIGSLVGGVLVAQTKRRKPVYLGLILCAFATIFLCLTASNPVLIMVFSALFGAFGMSIFPAQTTMIMETVEDPSLLSGAFAMTSGVSLLFNMVVPTIFVGMYTFAGTMAGGFRMLSFILLIAFVVGLLFLKETGVKNTSKDAGSAEQAAQ